MADFTNINERYSRQIALRNFGFAGQQKLLNSRVLIIGAGGLGCPALLYLAGAGIGHIGIVDHDLVSLSNLHRQVLYTTADIGLQKAACAARALLALNPGIAVEAYPQQLTVDNALGLLGRYDVIIDGTDNFASRYLINDACVLLGKPLIYGAVSQYEGQVAIFNCPTETAGAGVNYRDIFPEPPQAGEVRNCAEAGVLNVLPGIIGTMQAAEAIKLISATGVPLINILLTYNVLTNEVYRLSLPPASASPPNIPTTEAAFLAINYDWLCGTADPTMEIDAAAFDELLIRAETTFIDVREALELPLVTEFSHLRITLAGLRESLPDIGTASIAIFCQSGRRSLAAANYLSGIFGNSKKIYSLKSGIADWKSRNPII